MPVAIETSGVFQNETKKFVQQVGHGCIEVTGDPQDTSYPFQQILLGIQRGNVIACHGTFADEFLTNNFSTYVIFSQRLKFVKKIIIIIIIIIIITTKIKNK